MDRTILINAGIIAAICDCLLDGNRNSLTARVQQLLFHCGDGVGIRAVNRREVSGQLAYGIVQLCFRCRHVGRVQRQGIFLGVGFVRCGIGDRCRDGDLCRAACGQVDPAVAADARRIARVRDRVAVAGSWQGGFLADNMILADHRVDRVDRSLGDVCLPDGVEFEGLVILTAIVPVVTIVPLTLDDCFILILDWIIGTDCPTGKIIALTGESTLAQLHILAEGRRLVGHRAVDGAFVGILDVEFDNILIITPLGIKCSTFTENGISCSFYASVFFRVPAVERLAAHRRLRQRAIRSALFDVLGRWGARASICIKGNSHRFAPMRIQGNTLFGVFRREFILVGDLIAAFGRIKPALK